MLWLATFPPCDVARTRVYLLLRTHTCVRALRAAVAEKTLTQLRREYSDPTSRSNSSRLTEELSEVHSIMKRNIQEVLDRGEKLDCTYGAGPSFPVARHARTHVCTPIRALLPLRSTQLAHADVSRVSTRLADDSKHMKWGAKRLNLLDMWRTYGPFAILALFVLFILVWRFFL